MFDDLHFEDWAESIEEVNNPDLISLSPNPSSGEIRIRSKSKNAGGEIQIMDLTGQLVYDDKIFSGQILKTDQLTNGIYFLRYSDGRNFCIKKIIIQN